MTDREAEWSARPSANLEFVKIGRPPSSPSETTPLLPERLPQFSFSSLLGMSHLLGEKRSSSFSPPPLSRHAAAPPPSPAVGSIIDSTRSNTPETSRVAHPSATSNPSRPKLHRLRDRMKLSPSLTLENSGSVARDHLASERTFLAYIRTSLAIASTGVGKHAFRMTSGLFESSVRIRLSDMLVFEALVQLFTISGYSAVNPSPGNFTDTKPRIQRYAIPLGAATVIMGLVVLVIGKRTHILHNEIMLPPPTAHYFIVLTTFFHLWH